jgi:hypothetical protein
VVGLMQNNYQAMTMTDSYINQYDYKGMFWDDVSKQLYTWGELQSLFKERQTKGENNEGDQATN